MDAFELAIQKGWTQEQIEGNEYLKAVRHMQPDDARLFLTRKFKEIQQKSLESQREIELVEREGKAIDAVAKWLDSPIELQRPNASVAHKLAASIQEGADFHPHSKLWENDFLNARALVSSMGEFKPVSFVVEHDWASALAGAPELAEGEIEPPFDSTLFEFRISGRAACVWWVGDARVLFVDAGITWMTFRLDGSDDTTHPIVSLMRSQVRAICIALDAEVAVMDLQRAPERLNKAREKQGRPPIFSYHVLRLNRRSRAAPLPCAIDEPSHRKRLHFVRGHWRHFEQHKTWIKWHLRGDPDLGFIDKHYRL